MKKRLFIYLLVLLGVISGCSSTTLKNTAADKQESIPIIKVAYQYGLAYAPLIVCKENGMIEAAYREFTGNEIAIDWVQMSSGADINTAMASGDVSVGFMGVAPAITGITADVGYKVFTGLSGQEHGLITNDASIKDLSDIINSDKQIALVNVGSIQHIILAEALVRNGYDAHSLDSNIMSVKHPDGMALLHTGGVACHLTTNPYIYKERAQEDLYEIDAVKSAWSTDNSFIVGVASEDLYNKDQVIYQAVCEAIKNAVNDTNYNTKNVAKLTCEMDGNSFEEEVYYLESGKYDTKTKGIYELSQFMYENGFIEKEIKYYDELVFPNVVGD